MEYASNGDFKKFVEHFSGLRDERLVRTYFHQLIEGIEYLHSKGVAHMDIKLANLLLDGDYMLKIADFDNAYIEGDWNILGRGTKNYRAPELKKDTCTDAFATDIYSAGIVLFNLLTGCLPYNEDHVIEDASLLDLLREDLSLYWERLSRYGISLSEDAQELFTSMVRADPVERATLAEVKSSKWYSGEIYTKEQLRKLCLRL